MPLLRRELVAEVTSRFHIQFKVVCTVLLKLTTRIFLRYALIHLPTNGLEIARLAG